MRDRVIERLRAAGCVAAEAEADEMLAATTDPATLDGWIVRREHGVPLALSALEALAAAAKRHGIPMPLPVDMG